MVTPAAAIAAAPRARRLLTFNVPPDGHGVAEGLLGDDAGARLSSPSVLQVLHSKFGHPTHLARKAASRSVSAGLTRRPRSARAAQACIPPRRCRLPADRSQLPAARRTPLRERRT